MDRNAVALDGVLETSEDGLEQPLGTQWQRFFTSWTWAVILVAACAAGLFLIVRANPFASASVSDRVSAELGQPATCTEVGATQVAGNHSTIYKCTVGVQAHHLAQCFAVTDGDVAQVSGTRELGC
jgi:hypothetical protein